MMWSRRHVTARWRNDYWRGDGYRLAGWIQARSSPLHFGSPGSYLSLLGKAPTAKRCRNALQKRTRIIIPRRRRSYMGVMVLDMSLRIIAIGYLPCGVIRLPSSDKSRTD
ncbi:hypothetical protein KCP74_21065 [Salmonella enterica subsp. enterica]|nr:hypothetical protein KCP74_21065 [Salmonella enterica subsp. enterica]